MERLTPLALSEWPLIDEPAWNAAFAERHSLFGTTGAGRDLSQCTVKLYRTAYGIWLRHLMESEQLDPQASPGSRVTPQRLDGWIDAMRRAGRKDSTIALYLMSLHSVLRLIAPSSDTSFILRPRGTSLSRFFPSKPKPFMPVDTNDDLMRHVRALHVAGKQATTPFARRDLLRDAALMALCAMRALRVSSLAAMRLGKHLSLLRNGNCECHIPKSDVKGRRRRISWPLDEECSAMMRDYLTEGRPLFENAAATDALWLGNDGEPLTHVSISGIFRRRTRDWFGQAMGPHTARKWLRSTAARRSAEAAFDAAEVQGHSPQVSLRYYAEASELGAAQRHVQHIRELRRQTAGIAERFFAERERASLL